MRASGQGQPRHLCPVTYLSQTEAPPGTLVWHTFLGTCATRSCLAGDPGPLPSQRGSKLSSPHGGRLPCREASEGSAVCGRALHTRPHAGTPPSTAPDQRCPFMVKVCGWAQRWALPSRFSGPRHVKPTEVSVRCQLGCLTMKGWASVPGCDLCLESTSCLSQGQIPGPRSQGQRKWCLSLTPTKPGPLFPTLRPWTLLVQMP